MNITIKAARVNKDLSQSDVAHLLGMSLGTYQRLESNLGEMRLKHARRLAEILGVGIDSLFFGDDSSITVISGDEEVGSGANGDRDD